MGPTGLQARSGQLVETLKGADPFPLDPFPLSLVVLPFATLFTLSVAVTASSFKKYL